MSRQQVEKLVERLVQDIITDTNMELVDVEYVKERNWYLRVFLDKPGGIEVEDCQWVSEQLEVKLDELDPIKESYYLEVSSPGLDRPLKKDRDFIRHIGEKVEVHTFAPLNGSKLVVGTLTGISETDIHLDVNGTALSVPRDKTAQVKLYLEF
ncbi:protein of unknown function DUF150 [Thermosinus carboxydivorans Nor1]|uniref:Ribosome maturation factor RimP n=1 Tax=Thermosinus carboxydivorans Nor1 TaxID=401526 RepID=A1HSB0_9FIRM|nr:ribosome maturation factor RimP [Thermosinus carboxydivorans]EAX47072.1 protein of unknown function DUF150 [Thermosinus carboxydivorans Nor1]